MEDNGLNTVSHTLVLDAPKAFALQIAVADQLAIMHDALQTDLDDETRIQATRLHAIYMNLLDDLDINKEDLANRTSDYLRGTESNVVSMDDFRKEDLDDDSGKE